MTDDGSVVFFRPSSSVLRRFVKEARHRIARKTDDTAAIVVDVCDERVVHRIQLARQFFCAARCAERLRERFGERGKARKIGEESGAVRTIRERFTARSRAATIVGEIRCERGNRHAGNCSRRM